MTSSEDKGITYVDGDPRGGVGMPRRIDELDHVHIRTSDRCIKNRHGALCTPSEPPAKGALERLHAKVFDPVQLTLNGPMIGRIKVAGWIEKEMLAARQEGTSSAALVALSRWIDDGNAGRDPEAITWGRIAKLAEETGEVMATLVGFTGQNPRKGYTHSADDIVEELLDVAVTALGAVEHLRDHQGDALALLDDKIRRVADRAGVAP